MTRFRLYLLVLLLALAVTPALTACTAAPGYDRNGRGADYTGSV